MLLNILSPLCHQLPLLCVLVILFLSVPVASRDPDHALGERQAPIIPPLVNFQVSEPILTPVGDSDQYGCVHNQLLMDHAFWFSYGMPFI
ncbi:MAG: hypothetical protein Q9177_005960, partial [Variospora cf. flavescens]